MGDRENDREELEILVDKLEFDNWNADFEKSGKLREAGEDLKIAPDE